MLLIAVYLKFSDHKSLLWMIVAEVCGSDLVWVLNYGFCRVVWHKPVFEVRLFVGSIFALQSALGSFRLELVRFWWFR